MSKLPSRHGFTYFHYGRHALLLEWQDPLDHVFYKIQNIFHEIKQWQDDRILNVVPAFQSLLIQFRPELISPDQIIAKLESGPCAGMKTISRSKLITINIDISDQASPDLGEVAKKCQLSIEKVVELFISVEYSVRFLGFLPGFPYLTGLDPSLHLPRRSTPRVRVPKGSVAIAHGQCGIYPCESPGGWHILGRTDDILFDPYKDAPSPIMAGDVIRFLPK